MNSTVLIVEDHEGMRTALHDWLDAAFSGCRLLEAASGEEAIALAREHAPDIVLMDINLPWMNGIEATAHIKRDRPQTQVIVLTIHEDADYRAGAQAAGASAYVPKRQMYLDLLPVLAQLMTHPP